MVFYFQTFYYMLSLRVICTTLITNCWKWLISFFPKITGHDDIERLNFYEGKLIENCSNDLRTERVSIGQNSFEIWTISIKSKKNTACPVVFLHSIGYGAGFWFPNLVDISGSRTVYALDMLGFGRSSRTSFSSRLSDIEGQFIESLEAWRIKIGLDKFILLGHGFGGYVAFLYASRFPDRVKHIIFTEPWGFDADPKHYKRFRSSRPPTFPVTNATRLAAFFIAYLSHFSLLRFVGPGWGADLIKKLRWDLLLNFSKSSSADDVAQYLYYWNASYPPSGEKAFSRLSLYSGYAKHPLLFRINSIPKNVPMTFITGSRSSYVGRDIGDQVKQLRVGSYVDVQVINGTGHFVFVEKKELFDGLVSFICHQADNPPSATPATASGSRRKRCDSLPSLIPLNELGSKAPGGGPPIDAEARRRQHQASFCIQRTISEEDLS